MSWTEKNYKPCEREHMLEFRTDEECAHDRTHRSSLEIDRDERTKLPSGHAKHVWSAEQDTTLKNGLRAWRIYHMAQGEHDWGGPSQGLDTPKWTGKVVKLERQVMPSQDGRGVRSCSGKLARAEFYGPQWHRKQGRGGTSEVDQVEYDKLMKELGL